MRRRFNNHDIYSMEALRIPDAGVSTKFGIFPRSSVSLMRHQDAIADEINACTSNAYGITMKTTG